MATVRREHVQPAPHCAYCGQPIAAEAARVERFGERFCSERHAEEFAAGVRAARVEAAARRHADEAVGTAPRGRPRAYGIWVAAAAMLVVLGFAFIWGGVGAGTLAPVGGTLSTVLLLLACPLAMYFMMRGMHQMNGGDRHAGERPRESDETSRHSGKSRTDR